MIELNLLPESMRAVAKKKRSAIKFDMPQLPKLPIVLTVASVVVLIHLIVNIGAFSVNFRLKHLNKKLSNMTSQEQQAGQLKKELDELSNKIAVIDSLSSKSLIWSKKLFDLSKTITEGIWLTSLHLDEQQVQDNILSKALAGKPSEADRPKTRQVMILKGSAYSVIPAGETAIIGKFMESLKKNKDFFNDFEDVKLSSTQRKKLGKTEVMDFIIECYFKSGRRYFEKLRSET